MINTSQSILHASIRQELIARTGKQKRKNRNLPIKFTKPLQQCRLPDCLHAWDNQVILVTNVRLLDVCKDSITFGANTVLSQNNKTIWNYTAGVAENPCFILFPIICCSSAFQVEKMTSGLWYTFATYTKQSQSIGKWLLRSFWFTIHVSLHPYGPSWLLLNFTIPYYFLLYHFLSFSSSFLLIFCLPPAAVTLICII